MAELVGQHAFEFDAVHLLEQAGGHRDRRVLGAPARGEGVRDVAVDDRDPRLRQVGHRAQPLDHRVQLRRVVRRDDLRAGGLESELVGRPVLHDRQADEDHEHRHEPDVQRIEEHECEYDIEQAQEPARGEHPQRQPSVAAVRLALHGVNGSAAPMD